MSLGSSGNATIRRPRGRIGIIQKLVETLDLAGKRIAIERNGEIVPRSQHGETQLTDGDRLEIVVAVGGG
ncbi:MAG: thiamine biosynthesis protein ThiS [Hydrogenophilales bacterium 17-64-34]|nr:MAG: thiamine biosynthesis protein ThiS [Hydrogenophilales bacterium 17-64-34]